MLLLNASSIEPEKEFSLKRNGIHFNLEANKGSILRLPPLPGMVSSIPLLFHPGFPAPFTLRLRSIHTLGVSPGLPVMIKESSSWECGGFTKAPASFITCYSDVFTKILTSWWPNLLLSLWYYWQGMDVCQIVRLVAGRVAALDPRLAGPGGTVAISLS